ncbi:SRPBCC family protein [Saccharopolyspora griseoalba]|uniref:SRPBCC family protein n=1 Tax=Saccharopolyspora griseoalba TaxID=1431848 RepID=A0ABW2LE40_9PSEU
MEWTGARYADKPTVQVETWINASPERVWELVSEIELMPELSPELQSVEWQDGATGPALGARFVGRNEHDALGQWHTTSHIVDFDPPRSFGWAVQDPDDPTATWRFTLVLEAGGTLLRQWMQMGPARSGLSLAIEQMPEKEQKIVFVRLREHETNMTGTVAAIKELAEGSGEAGS